MWKSVVDSVYPLAAIWDLSSLCPLIPMCISTILNVPSIRGVMRRGMYQEITLSVKSTPPRREEATYWQFYTLMLTVKGWCSPVGQAAAKFTIPRPLSALLKTLTLKTAMGIPATLRKNYKKNMDFTVIFKLPEIIIHYEVILTSSEKVSGVL